MHININTAPRQWRVQDPDHNRSYWLSSDSLFCLQKLSFYHHTSFGSHVENNTFCRLLLSSSSSTDLYCCVSSLSEMFWLGYFFQWFQFWNSRGHIFICPKGHVTKERFFITAAKWRFWIELHKKQWIYDGKGAHNFSKAQGDTSNFRILQKSNSLVKNQGLKAFASSQASFRWWWSHLINFNAPMRTSE